MSWLDKLLEASEEEVDDVIDKAVQSNDAQGIEDVSQADTAVKDADVRDDPDALVYDKTDCYSQDIEVGEEKVAGEIDIDNVDTDTKVKSGNETPQVTEGAKLTRGQMQAIYSECVAEVIRESADEINAKYKEKVAAAKAWKTKQLAKLKEKMKKEKAEKAKAVAEAADVEGMLKDIFSKF